MLLVSRESEMRIDPSGKEDKAKSGISNLGWVILQGYDRKKMTVQSLTQSRRKRGKKIENEDEVKDLYG